MKALLVCLIMLLSGCASGPSQQANSGEIYHLSERTIWQADLTRPLGESNSYQAMQYVP